MICLCGPLASSEHKYHILPKGLWLQRQQANHCVIKMVRLSCISKGGILPVVMIAVKGATVIVRSRSQKKENQTYGKTEKVQEPKLRAYMSVL